MALRPGRIVAVLAAVGLAVWWGRLLAHAKVPPPEGRWREIPPDAFA